MSSPEMNKFSNIEAQTKWLTFKEGISNAFSWKINDGILIQILLNIGPKDPI